MFLQFCFSSSTTNLSPRISAKSQNRPSPPALNYASPLHLSFSKQVSPQPHSDDASIGRNILTIEMVQSHTGSVDKIKIKLINGVHLTRNLSAKTCRVVHTTVHYCCSRPREGGLSACFLHTTSNDTVAQLTPTRDFLMGSTLPLKGASRAPHNAGAQCDSPKVKQFQHHSLLFIRAFVSILVSAVIENIDLFLFTRTTYRRAPPCQQSSFPLVRWNAPPHPTPPHRINPRALNNVTVLSPKCFEANVADSADADLLQ